MITGANSAVGLRSMPVRYLFLDEVDAYPADLDGTGIYKIDTGIGFLNHMLEQLSKHSLVDINLKEENIQPENLCTNYNLSVMRLASHSFCVVHSIFTILALLHFKFYFPCCRDR